MYKKNSKTQLEVFDNKVRKVPEIFYIIAAFTEGAAVIGVELLGARILSPYFGTSLIVWTIVIGCTIGFLSIGYFTGGKLILRGNLLSKLSVTFLMASLFIAIMPLWSRILFLIASNLPLYSGCTFVSVLLLGPPLWCLGTTSPLIIQELTHNINDAGKSAGKVYAVSTIGGILFTFLFGFIIIPTLGISKPLLFMSLILLAISVFLGEGKKQIPLQILVVVVFVYSLFSHPEGKKNGHYLLLFESEGLMGQLKVLEYKEPLSDTLHRYMLINGIAHTNMTHNTKLNTEGSSWDYVHKVSMIASLKRNSENTLILGFGGGNLASEMKMLNMKVDAVDIDGRVIDVAKGYFFYNDPRLHFVIDDARHYIRTVKKKYDLIVFDVLNNTQPSYVFTLESLTELKSVLTDSGLVIIEFQELEKSKGNYVYQSICNTFLSLGYKTYFLDDEGTDIIIVASLQDVDKSKLKYEDLTPCCKDKRWAFEFINQPFYSCKSPFIRGEILTDDKPMIDVLNSEMVKYWRINSNRIFSNEMISSGQRIFN